MEHMKISEIHKSLHPKRISGRFGRSGNLTVTAVSQEKLWEILMGSGSVHYCKPEEKEGPTMTGGIGMCNQDSGWRRHQTERQDGSCLAAAGFDFCLLLLVCTSWPLQQHIAPPHASLNGTVREKT
jgi:hypothetical protein